MQNQQAETTRQQLFMQHAISNINAIANQNNDIKKTYGGLCHKFPMLILSCGLCQAVAFNESKAAGDKPLNKAHKLINQHLGAILKQEKLISAEETNNLSDAISKMDVRKYMISTRILLSSLIYYKRFAESILGVSAADAQGDN